MADKTQIAAVAIALAKALKDCEARLEVVRKALLQEQATHAALIRTRNILLHGHEYADREPSRTEQLGVYLEVAEEVRRHGTLTASRRKAVLDVLAAVNGPMSPAQIAEQAAARLGIQLDKWALRDLLSDMTRDGAIVKVAHGEYAPRVIFHTPRKPPPNTSNGSKP